MISLYYPNTHKEIVEIRFVYESSLTDDYAYLCP